MNLFIVRSSFQFTDGVCSSKSSLFHTYLLYILPPLDAGKSTSTAPHLLPSSTINNSLPLSYPPTTLQTSDPRRILYLCTGLKAHRKMKKEKSIKYIVDSLYQKSATKFSYHLSRGDGSTIFRYNGNTIQWEVNVLLTIEALLFTLSVIELSRRRYVKLAVGRLDLRRRSPRQCEHCIH